MAAGPESRGPGLVGRLASSAALEFRRRISKADLDERDPDYIRDQLPFLWMLSSPYLR